MLKKRLRTYNTMSYTSITFDQRIPKPSLVVQIDVNNQDNNDAAAIENESASWVNAAIFIEANS